MARTHYIAGNWKMNTTKAEAVALAKDLVEQLKGKTNKLTNRRAHTAHR